MTVQRNLNFAGQSCDAEDLSSFSVTDLLLICFSSVVFGQSLSNLFGNSREAYVTGVKENRPFKRFSVSVCWDFMPVPETSSAIEIQL